MTEQELLDGLSKHATFSKLRYDGVLQCWVGHVDVYSSATVMQWKDNRGRFVKRNRFGGVSLLTESLYTLDKKQIQNAKLIEHRQQDALRALGRFLLTPGSPYLTDRLGLTKVLTIDRFITEDEAATLKPQKADSGMN